MFVMQDNFSCLEIMNLNRDSKHRISKEQGNPVLVRAKVLHPGNWVLLGGWGGASPDRRLGVRTWVRIGPLRSLTAQPRTSQHGGWV